MDISQLLAKANEEIISLKNQLSSQKGVNTKLKNVISDLHQQLAVMANKYEQMLKNSDRMIIDYAKENEALKREIEQLRSQIRQVS
jgi:CII-binding regulator of phage lambda lysogenization HflD